MLLNKTRNDLTAHNREVSKTSEDKSEELTDPVTLTVVMAGVTVAAIASISAAR